MSKKYCEIFSVKSDRSVSPEVRVFVQRPGSRNEDGSIKYYTEQSHKNECDVNNIIRKYDKTGLISHITRFEATFGDVSGIDFKSAQDKIAEARSLFEQLPSKIRERFDNEPHKLLSFMDDKNNRDEAIKLGLIRKEWSESEDGIGEHITKEKAEVRESKSAAKAAQPPEAKE